MIVVVYDLVIECCEWDEVCVDVIKIGLFVEICVVGFEFFVVIGGG